MSAQNSINKTPDQMNDAEKTAHIKAVVLQAGQELRERHPWLKHQNTIGASIMLLSLAGMIGTAYLYYAELIAWYVCVPVVAIFASFIHELEHDLIHSMYFRKNPAINKLMLITGWVARPSTVNPLVRRKLHLHHHKHSGTESDLEERGITNGTPWGLKRLLMLGDNMLSVYLRPIETFRMVRKFIHAQKPKDQAEINKMAWEQRLSYAPIGNAYYAAWHAYFVFQVVSLSMAFFGTPLSIPTFAEPVLAVMDFLLVALILPSVLRTFCLHFISSNMHYYGDVEDRNVMQQTQVLNPWWLMPFQLFCFNFGATHAIHHFVVKEPFYVRQWTASTAHEVMREMGVRFNDIGTFKRANRFYPVDAKQTETVSTAAA